jgi:hypothetical protein
MGMYIFAFHNSQGQSSPSSMLLFHGGEGKSLGRGLGLALIDRTIPRAGAARRSMPRAHRHAKKSAPSRPHPDAFPSRMRRRQPIGYYADHGNHFRSIAPCDADTSRGADHGEGPGREPGGFCRNPGCSVAVNSGEFLAEYIQGFCRSGTTSGVEIKSPSIQKAKTYHLPCSRWPLWEGKPSISRLSL